MNRSKQSTTPQEELDGQSIAYAQKLTKQKRWSEAITFIDSRLGSLPTNKNIEYQLKDLRIRALYYRGDYAKVIAEAKPLLEVNPSNYNVVSCLMESLRKLHKFEVANEVLASIRKRGINYHWVYHEQCANLWSMAKYGEALAAISAGIELYPTVPSLYYSKAELQQVMQRPNDALESINGALNKARSRAEKEKDKNKNYIHYYLLRANILNELGRPVEANEDVNRALSWEPENPYIHLTQGRILQGYRPNEAMKAYSRCLKINPGITECYAMRTFLAISSPNWIHMVPQDVTKALAIGKYSPTLVEMRAEAYQCLGELNKAIADLTQVLSTNPKLDILFKRGKLYERLGKKEAALADYDAVIKKERIHYVLARRAKIYEEMGNLVQARNDLSDALVMRPGFQHLRNRANVNYKLGDLEATLKDLNECIGLDETSESAYRLRATVLKQLGRNSDAAADQKRADRIVQMRNQNQPPRLKLNMD